MVLTNNVSKVHLQASPVRLEFRQKMWICSWMLRKLPYLFPGGVRRNFQRNLGNDLLVCTQPRVMAGLFRALVCWDGGADHCRMNTSFLLLPADVLPGTWASQQGLPPGCQCHPPTPSLNQEELHSHRRDQVEGVAHPPGQLAEFLSQLNQEAHKKTYLWVTCASPVSTRLAPGKGQQRGVENNALL